MGFIPPSVHMKRYFPIFLDLEGKNCLVAGGGGVALRKITGLLQCGARVTVVCKEAENEIELLAAEKKISLIKKDISLFCDSQTLQIFSLIFAATDDPSINGKIFTAARERNILCCSVDDPSNCSFITPSLFDIDEFTFAVSSHGRHPGAVRRLREFLESEKSLIRQMLQGHKRPRGQKRTGKVYITGAGCGSAGMLTLRAFNAINAADVVIHDYLISPEVLSLIPDGVEVISLNRSRSRRRGASRFRQEMINRIMLEKAREGKIVVRLKSGDPLVFGRGGEEASFLDENGIPFEIVPGITAALSCAADAGIPLTDRRFSPSVTLFSGTDSEECKRRGTMTAGTFVIYMGIEGASSVREKLLERGLDMTTPIAIIENGGSDDRRIFFSDVAHLPDCISANEIKSPAIIIAGEVVRHALCYKSCFVSPASARLESLL